LSPASLRRLLLGILLPVLLFVADQRVDALPQALSAADTAYDRTLLASAKSIGELLEVVEAGGRPRLKSTVPYSALEAFEADNRSRMYYKVTGFEGEMVSGFADLPPVRPDLGDPNVYAALVRFYDDEFRGEPVRMAVLLQPVAGESGQGMATIQVAETLELRTVDGAQLLVRHAVAAGRAGPADCPGGDLGGAARDAAGARLSASVQQRAEDDLSEVAALSAPRELQPVVAAINTVMARLAGLLATRSASCATPRTSCAHRWRCSRPRCSRRAAAMSIPPGAEGNRPRCSAPPSLPTRCWRWPRWSSCAQQGDAPTLDWGAGRARRRAGAVCR
jgi:two-component system sensor histidine kinase TctE